jgi:tetratricopeptide (TPR) repeat protein
MMEYGERAMAYEDRLSPRYQFMLEAWNALNHLEPGGVEVLKEAVKKYPDDPETWFLLAETYIHVGDATYGTEEDIVRAIDRAVGLDPDFAPYYLHVADFHVIRGDSVKAREAMDRYEKLTGHRRGLEHVEYAIPIFLGDSAQAAAAVQTLMNEDPRVPGLVEGTYTQRMDPWDRAFLLNDAIEATQGVNRDAFRLYGSANQGAMAQATRFVDELNVSEGALGIFFGHANELWDWTPGPDHASLLEPSLCAEPAFNAWCHVFMGGLFVREERWDDAEATRASLMAQADQALAEDPEADVEFLQVAAQYLGAYEAFRRGQHREAKPALLEMAPRSDLVGGRARLALGELEASEGHVDEAIRHYLASLNGWQRPRAVLELARLYERAGDEQQALGYWERVLVSTRAGDPDFPVRLEAQEAVARLNQ